MQESLYLEFDPIVSQEVVEFFSQSKLVTYRKGEIICRSDTPDQRVFCSQDGCVTIYSLTPDGKRDIHTFTRSKTVFPITDMFTPAAVDYYLPSRTKFFEAMTDMRVWQMPAQAFTEFVSESPEFEIALLRQFCLNHRVHTTRIEMMQLRDLQKRVICFLLVLGLLVGTADEKHTSIDIPVTHQLVADSLSIARETASRELSKLRKQHLIEYHGHNLYLPDVPYLKRLIENY